MRSHLLAVLLILAATTANAVQPYLRLGLGAERSQDVTQRDRNCGDIAPPALFGCGSGPDGRTFGARGDFGRSFLGEVAGGFAIAPRTRLELALAHRGDLAFDAQSNFLGVAGEQPVHASARSTSALLTGFLDIRRVFVFAGAGAARNTLGTVTYAFPGIAPNAVTIAQGGTHTAFAWTAGAGMNVPLSNRLSLDLALRFTDLGAFRTRSGPATIIRPTRSFTLDIAGTEAHARTLGLVASLRWRL